MFSFSNFSPSLNSIFQNISHLALSPGFKLVCGSTLIAAGAANVCYKNSKYKPLGVLAMGTGLLLILSDSLQSLDPLYVPMPDDFCEREEIGINYVSSKVDPSSAQYTPPISLVNSNFSFFSDCVSKISSEILDIKEVSRDENCTRWIVRTPFWKFTNFLCACLKEVANGVSEVDVISKSATGVYDLYEYNKQIVEKINFSCGF